MTTNAIRYVMLNRADSVVVEMLDHTIAILQLVDFHSRRTCILEMLEIARLANRVYLLHECFAKPGVSAELKQIWENLTEEEPSDELDYDSDDWEDDSESIS